MARGGMSEVSIFDPESLSELTAALHDTATLEVNAAEEAHRVKMQNLKEELAFRQQTENTLAQLGITLSQEDLARKKESLKAEIEAEIAGKEAVINADKSLTKSERQAKIAQMKREMKQRLSDETDFLDKKYKADAKFADKFRKDQAKKRAKEQSHAAGKELSTALFSAGMTGTERMAAIKGAWADAKKLNTTYTDPETGETKKTVGAELGAVANMISDMAKQLDNKIDTVGYHKAAIDTRLQGSKQKTSMGSYWESMSSDIIGAAGVSPFVKQEKIVEDLESFVKKGISYNVEQRAFLQTISEKIATTFNAADGTLLRLIRIQQQDSTAGRLGMESALNSFLNQMYETSEYLSDLAANVRGSLEEAQALMGAADATELEYQVQKWMGSMYSVGMSSKGVQGIADAFGKAIAGDISGITSGGTGNLVVMAANYAGISIADMLAEGLDSKETNTLLAAMAEYLEGIYNESKDSRVVQQQLANVYGLSASDLKAISNLASKNGIASVYSTSKNYSQMVTQLNNMASTMYQRTSIGEMMTNAWSNLQYTMAAGIANNPVLYATYKIAGLLDTAVGGIAIPAISVMGNMVDLHTTVADLMRVLAMSGSILGGIGKMIFSGGGGGITGTGMLRAMKVSGNLTSVERGEVAGAMKPQLRTTASTSESGSLVANGSGDDVKDQTMASAADQQNEEKVSAEENEEQDLKNKDLNESITQIYDLLKQLTSGTLKLAIKQEYDYSGIPGY